MDKTTAQVLALSRFLGISSLHEGWHANRFHRLVKTVTEELKEKHGIDYFMGMDVDWTEWGPEHVTVSIRGVVTSDQMFLEQWPLTGPVGSALLEDFKILASDKAMQDIERERLEQLRREANQRVASLMSAAEGFAEDETANRGTMR